MKLSVDSIKSGRLFNCAKRNLLADGVQAVTRRKAKIIGNAEKHTKLQLNPGFPMHSPFTWNGLALPAGGHDRNGYGFNGRW